MTVPTGGDNPNRYQPNPTDDRAILGAAPHSPFALAQSSAYLAVATALDAIEEMRRETGFIPDAAPYLALDPQSRRAIRAAESALRRAAFGIVVHARPDGD